MYYLACPCKGHQRTSVFRGRPHGYAPSLGFSRGQDSIPFTGGWGFGKKIFYMGRLSCASNTPRPYLFSNNGTTQSVFGV